jgi:hypothetical protein
VVAEKTGYPAEMLTMEMALEADLGIDSIKRVEILSAMQERAPGLPQVQAREMAALKTLGQIVGHLDGGAAPAAQAPASTAGTSESPSAAQAPITRLSVREVSAPATGLAPAGLFSWGPVAVVDDGGGVGPELARALTALGLEATVVAQAPIGSRAVVFLGGLRDGVDELGAIAINREAFSAARACAPALSAGPGLFVTVQDTGGDFGLSGGSGPRAWLGGLTGLAKTAALEWPQAHVRAIDIDRAGRSARALGEALAAELVAGGVEREVGLHADGARTTLDTHATAAGQGELVIDGRSVVVATGGARGVTAATLIALARDSRARFALLGRTAVADEPAGCAGVTDEAQLSRAVLAALKSAG